MPQEVDNMADVVNETVAALNESAKNATQKPPASPEGMAVAYGSLVFMALIPIFFGSFRSVKYQKEQKQSGEKPETMSNRDAAMFPVIASITLFGIYLFFQDIFPMINSVGKNLSMPIQSYHSNQFTHHNVTAYTKIFSKEYINLLLTVYFFFLGVLALAHIASPVVNMLMPASFPNEDYHLLFTQGKDDKKEDVLNYKFDRRDLVCLLLCTGMGVWYLLKKHWIANNLFGLAFAVNGVELLQLNKVSTGCILLGGLFFYDIFWVFATNVMVTVAKSFEAPIKLVFPQDLLEKGLEANNFAMLGLGDIVIPGIFIALLLRFDISVNKNKRTYFYASFLAYFLGLLATIFVMHVFKHAQPALLYLVPACIGVPLLVAGVKGELKALFSYEDNPEEKQEATEKEDGKTEVKKEK